METRKYFVLDETLPEDEISLMMGRVVASVVNPLGAGYRPRDPVKEGDKHHNTQDILPNILPKPVESGDRKDILNNASTNQLKAKLERIFGLDIAKDSHSQLTIRSKKVQRYTLKQNKEIFEELMKDKDYASQIHDLLQISRKAYMVSGFLTTENTSWDKGQGVRKSASTNVTVSQETTGLVGADASVEAKTERNQEQSMSEETSQKVIFAVSYDVVRLEYQFYFSSKRFLEQKVRFGGEKRASSRHLALGSGDKELEVEEDDEDDKNAEPQPSQTQVARYSLEVLLDKDLLDSKELPFALEL